MTHRSSFWDHAARVFLGHSDKDSSVLTTAVGPSGKPLSGSPSDLFLREVVPSDEIVYDPPLRGFRVGGSAGNVTVVSDGGIVTIASMQIGESIGCNITQILATGTAATGIVAWQGES